MACAHCHLTLTIPPQICLPAAFFLLMWIPRYYIKPMSHGQVVVSASVDLESRMWAGAIPYSGPAGSPGTGGRAHILLAPAADGTNAARVSELAEVLGKGLACPRDKESWNCPSPLIPWSFHCMFLNRSAGQQCQVTSHVLPGHTPHGTTWNRFIPVWYNQNINLACRCAGSRQLPQRPLLLQPPAWVRPAPGRRLCGGGSLAGHG